MQPVANAINAIMQTGNTPELLAMMDHLFDNPPLPVFGVQKQPGVSIEKARQEANQAALDVLARVNNDPRKLTEEDKAALRKYSGLGGIGGSIHEYYTPSYVAEGIWDAMAAMGMGPGNYLEPSAGTGVFHGAKPKGAVMTATEIDATSSQINQLLHPGDRVKNSSFETLAVAAEDDSWDGCVGNVPFGSTRGKYGAIDPEYARMRFVDQYFITRMVDKVKPGKLICVVVPMRIVSRPSWAKWRRQLSLKAEFLGAHRLPSGTFSDNGTDTATDVLVLRKHPAELAEIINERKTRDLVAANVLWDTWINGKWFDSAEGKRFIHGEQSISGEGKFARTVVDGGDLDSAAIKQRLAHKFESRIDWLALELAEPEIKTYAEGDERLMNGRWRRLVNGMWQEFKRTGKDGDSIDAATYGMASLKALRDMLTDSPLAALELTYEQIMNVARDFPDVLEGELENAIQFAKRQPGHYRERLIRGTIIGQRIRDLATLQEKTGEFPAEEGAEVRQLVKAELARYGAAANDSAISTLRGGQAGAWNAFAASTDKNGTLSDLLEGKRSVGGGRAYDPTDAEQVIAHLYSKMDLNPVDITDLAAHYRGTVPLSLDELAKVPGVAITPDGMVAPLDRATTGHVVATSRALIKAMASTSNQAVIDNFQRQLELIESKRKRTAVDDITMTMTAKWIPRQYVAEFLRDQGYSKMTYSKVVERDGELVEDFEYQGEGGVWGGYTKASTGKSEHKDEKIERQVEKYLNGMGAKSSNKAATAEYREKIRRIEEDFGVWLRQHDDIEQLTNLYNDTYNGYVPVEHSAAPLGLVGVNAELTAFDYQNQAVRRLSEDGRGVLGFGTGLGKTTTALSLVAYNTQLGRAKRTAVVVPKAVLENWYHETIAVLGRDYLDKCLFVGLEPVRDKKTGEILQVPVLDDEGQPKLGKDGTPLMRDKTREQDGDKVIELLNQIPHTNKTMVVMTKERYGEIPLTPESIIAHVDRMTDAGLKSGKLSLQADNYREAMKKEKHQEKHSDTGTAKNLDIPYFEAMGFDSVIVDEGHNYRNTYEGGRATSKLAYLPNPQSADIAMDMAVKNAWLLNKYQGRGPVFLTATPTVNSPCDIFNMLSHVMTIEEWGEYGIGDIDDFIRVFGETAEVNVMKLSGDIEAKEGLVGFKNLSGLRGIFHRHCNLKSAKDVSETVKIPTLVESQVEADMTEEQEAIYEELRERAAALSNKSKDEDGNEVPDQKADETDSVFAVIADMERVVTDLDLYHKTMTFIFPLDHAEAVEKLVADLPDSIKRKVSANATARDDEDDFDEADELDEETGESKGKGKTVTIITPHNAKITRESGAVRLVVADVFEGDVVARLDKFKIPPKAVTHPVMPKYAKLLENLKTGYEAGGKQLVFVEDKRQHNKIRRLIAYHLGIEASQIGIINATTAAGSKDFVDDKGKKLVGVEPLAAAYNEGRFRILICNRKAEVGVNLHHGTTAIHHLTLPWTPASIKQRNGRGARVGAKQASVAVHYYVGKGSFDEWRLQSLKKKAEWQEEIMGKDGLERAKNADADDADEVGILLAKDPEERKAKIAETLRLEKKRLQDAAIQRGNINLHNYLKACHDADTDPEELQKKIGYAEADAAVTLAQIADAEKMIARYDEALLKEENSYMVGARNVKKEERLKLLTKLKGQRGQRVALARRLERVNKASDLKKRLRSDLERAIKEGLVKAPLAVLDQGSQFLSDGIRTIQVGKLYDTERGYVLRVTSVNFETKATMAEVVYYQRNPNMIGTKMAFDLEDYGAETTRTPSELDLLVALARPISPADAVKLLNASQFTEHLVDGTLDLDTNNMYLVAEGESFTSGYQAAYEGAPVKVDMRQVVYPDASNAGLKARLAKWLLADRSQLTNSKMKPWWVAIFGDDVVATVESYGEQAPEQVINAWLSQTLEAYRAQDDVKAELQRGIDQGHATAYASFFKHYANRRFPAEWANQAAFEAVIEQGTAALAEEQKQGITAATIRKNAEAKARYELAESKGDEGREERLAWLASQFTRGNAYDTARTLRTGNPYGNKYPLEGGGFDIELALVDIVATGAIERPVLDGDSVLSNVQSGFNTGFYNLVAENKRRYKEWVISKIPPKAPTEEDAQKGEEAKKVIAASTGQEHYDWAPSMTFRVNTQPITLKLDKYNKKTFGPGELLGIHDELAFQGKLYANKETIKARYAAMYNNDKKGLTEYPDSWWFIPANTPIDALKDLYGEAA
ncbi:SNF2-related protein [Aeromonas rivipollensis]|uniref:SNF2-related protein n=1 Tax=Aeromonas rivipollensis TaxID=948519 RepID=UPI0038D0B711